MKASERSTAEGLQSATWSCTVHYSTPWNDIGYHGIGARSTRRPITDSESPLTGGPKVIPDAPLQLEVYPCSLPSKRSREPQSTSSARTSRVWRDTADIRLASEWASATGARVTAISAGQGITSALWAGTFLVQPGAKTGSHHHGEQETVVFRTSREKLSVRWGDLGEHRATVQAGDFLHVPSWLPHQELNLSTTTPFRWIVVRSTREPIVVNLPDDFWGPARTGS
jgi:uncharacterized RmlC-like cupin family protein